MEELQFVFKILVYTISNMTFFYLKASSSKGASIYIHGSNFLWFAVGIHQKSYDYIFELNIFYYYFTSSQIFPTGLIPSLPSISIETYLS